MFCLRALLIVSSITANAGDSLPWKNCKEETKLSSSATEFMPAEITYKEEISQDGNKTETVYAFSRIMYERKISLDQSIRHTFYSSRGEPALVIEELPDLKRMWWYYPGARHLKAEAEALSFNHSPSKLVFFDSRGNSLRAWSMEGIALMGRATKLCSCFDESIINTSDHLKNLLPHILKVLKHLD
jgi:hypothetical protein